MGALNELFSFYRPGSLLFSEMPNDCHSRERLCSTVGDVDQAERGGRVPRRGNLWDVVDLVNLGALSCKIVGI